MEKGADAEKRVNQIDDAYEQKIVEKRTMYLSAFKSLFAKKTVFSV
jgi:hypothetical protein